MSVICVIWALEAKEVTREIRTTRSFCILFYFFLLIFEIIFSLEAKDQKKTIVHLQSAEILCRWLEEKM